MIYGTIVSSFIALIVSVPLSLGAAIFLSEILSERSEPLSRIDELHLPLSMVRLAIRNEPDVSRDAGVVEHVERHATMASSQSLSMM